MSLAFLSENTRALADLEKLESIEPLHPRLYRVRGLLAERAGRLQDAAAAFTKALEIDPENNWTRLQRGYAYRDAGEQDKALKDADSLLQREPGWPYGHMLRSAVFMDRKDFGKARAEAEAILFAADKHAESAYGFAAHIYERIGDKQRALQALDNAVAAFPTAPNYLTRAEARPFADVAARRTDIEAALGLEPNNARALHLLVQLELDAGKWDDVIKAANRAMEQGSMKDYTRFLMTSRGIAHAKRADMEKASRDFAAARLAATAPVDLNNMCYQIAKHDVALKTALASCDASLAQVPNNANTLDSKAFTLMRLKRYAEALAIYDAAVKADGKIADAWYGRGMVKHRMGNKTGGQADIKAALALEPDVGAQFARMDLVP